LTERERAERYLLLLDLEWGASTDDVRRSYRELAHVWHPDRFERPGLKRRATRKLQQLNEIKEWLVENLERVTVARTRGLPDVELDEVFVATNPQDRWRAWAESNNHDPDHTYQTPEPPRAARPRFRDGLISETIGVPNFLLVLLFCAARWGGAIAAITVLVSFAFLARTFYRWTQIESGNVLFFNAAVFAVALAIWLQ